MCIQSCCTHLGSYFCGNFISQRLLFFPPAAFIQYCNKTLHPTATKGCRGLQPSQSSSGLMLFGTWNYHFYVGLISPHLLLKILLNKEAFWLQHTSMKCS